MKLYVIIKLSISYPGAAPTCHAVKSKLNFAATLSDSLRFSSCRPATVAKCHRRPKGSRAERSEFIARYSVCSPLCASHLPPFFTLRVTLLAICPVTQHGSCHTRETAAPRLALMRLARGGGGTFSSHLLLVLVPDTGLYLSLTVLFTSTCAPKQSTLSCDRIHRRQRGALPSHRRAHRRKATSFKHARSL